MIKFKRKIRLLETVYNELNILKLYYIIRIVPTFVY